VYPRRTDLHLDVAKYLWETSFTVNTEELLKVQLGAITRPPHAKDAYGGDITRIGVHRRFAKPTRRTAESWQKARRKLAENQRLTASPDSLARSKTKAHRTAVAALYG